MSWPAVKQGLTQEEFRKYVTLLEWSKWRPTRFVWHNTAAPSLAQWMSKAKEDVGEGLMPGTTRINNLERYFRDNNGWSGCPHLFIANDLIWVMNALTLPGVHSPSWNHISIGIEMIGDFSREDDESGEGFKVKQNTIFATAILCAELGILPSTETIFLHKQDPKTTHDCPGKNIAVDKLDMIASVAELMLGGEHNPRDVTDVISGNLPSPMPKPREGVVTINDLNFRRGPGVENESTGTLNTGVKLTILSEAGNWYRVKTPAGYVGWVAKKFVKETKS